MIASVRSTSSAEVAVYVDRDQESLYARPDCKLTVGDRIGPVHSLNALVKQHPGYAVYAAATDDCEFVTRDWDRWLLDRARERPVAALAPYVEGSPGALDFPALTAGWIKTIGHMAHPTIGHFYWDLAVQIVAEHCGCCLRAQESEFTVKHHGIAPEVDNMRCYFDAKAFAVWAFKYRLGEIRRVLESLR